MPASSAELRDRFLDELDPGAAAALADASDVRVLALDAPLHQDAAGALRAEGAVVAVAGATTLIAASRAALGARARRARR